MEVKAILSKYEFSRMNLYKVAEYHGMTMVDFISEVYPAKTLLPSSEHFYKAYFDWYVSQTPLGKLL